MAGNLTVVLKADRKLKEKLTKFYCDDFCEKTPQYAIFQAKTEDCTITLYQSGKLMFQGKGAERESSIWNAWMQKQTSVPQAKAVAAPAVYTDTTAIGSDEVGTGDFFGPIVVTAAFVREEQFALLRQLGVRDSKKLTDEKICRIVPQIMEAVPHVTRVLGNEEYNRMRANGINMNQVKALIHNDCLFRLKKQLQDDSVLVVVDQFEPPAAYYRHLSGEANVIKDICFMTKAEDQCMAVACASMISRARFLKEMDLLAESIGHPEGIPLGAGNGVDAFTAALLEEQGPDILQKIAKMNFANVEKVRQLYDQAR
ncbi:MAG: ribonuclease HIII [Agathobacter sp.]|uniref:ribonuclease HIII n=1 Tax=Agathobacter sp. TaxID=2021311 RepID=UPI00257C178C|nr:ribonuclease HIII [Agathobacter sp.]MBQ1681741.1 ribonuclease HIII [Agathobacter sp.]